MSLGRRPLTDDEAWEKLTRPGAFDWIAVVIAVVGFLLVAWVIVYSVPFVFRALPNPFGG